MVIQRWQSLLLLIAVVLMACFSFVSLGQIQTTDYTFNFTALGLCSEGQPTAGANPPCVSTWYLFAVSILSAVISLVAIFTYKKLPLQKNLCLIAVLLIICVIIAAAVIAYQSFDGASISWSSWVCAPFLSLITVLMAYNRISADQRIIRESERLR